VTGAPLSRAERSLIVEQSFTTARTVIRTVGWVGAAYTLTFFAGQSTSVAVNATLSLLADLKFVLSLTLAGGTVAWAMIERSLRHRKVSYLQNRIRELETSIDRKRTSSGLTAKGKTNPKDIKP
jgi:hypothetical protein